MTRTERNQDPRALLKDRHSRSGLTKSELTRKNGAGAHNWGSYAQERDMSTLAEGDARVEQQQQGGMFDMDEAVDAVPDMAATANAIPRGSVSSSTDDDAIASSPTDSTASLPSETGGARAMPMPGRRMSNVSEEEREKARSYREGVMHKGSFDLANIAKTSYGIAQSPPSNGFSTSPIKAKGGFGMSQ